MFLSLLRTKQIMPALISEDQARNAFYEVSVSLSVSPSVPACPSPTHLPLFSFQPPKATDIDHSIGGGAQTRSEGIAGRGGTSCPR
jgi:hypothetical protein